MRDTIERWPVIRSCSHDDEPGCEDGPVKIDASVDRESFETWSGQQVAAIAGALDQTLASAACMVDITVTLPLAIEVTFIGQPYLLAITAAPRPT